MRIDMIDSLRKGGDGLNSEDRFEEFGIEVFWDGWNDQSGERRVGSDVFFAVEGGEGGGTTSKLD